MVDLYGEALQCTVTTGDHFRKRHDAFKMKLLRMCQWAGLDAEVEVFNLFAGSGRLESDGERAKSSIDRT